MRDPDGRIDSTTRVLWLQTQSLYADLRVPAGLDCRPEVRGFEDLDHAELVALAGLNGFAGTLDFDGAICRWHRELDYRPPGGPADEARAALDGDTLIETGLHADYVEDWHRQTPAGAPLIAFRRRERPAGILVFAGEHVIEIVDRASPLPGDTDLRQLVAEDLARGDRTSAERRLGMRISYGRRSGDGDARWLIELSTFPWLVGRPLFTRAIWDTVGGLVFEDSDVGWSLISASLDRPALLDWFG
jgi:hypothetical protein